MSAQPKRILVLVTRPTSSDELRDQVETLVQSQPVSLRVVAPASQLSPLEWLANEEDGARSEAEANAEQASGTLDAVADAIEVEVGDADPIQAAEDALRTFPADELIVVAPPEQHATWLERASVRDGFEQFGLPVHYVSATEAEPRAEA
jgi:hypothetical protein